MACGIGACLACVCKTKEKDAHSNVNNKRICKDGPVFLSTEVDLLMDMKVNIAGARVEESGYSGFRYIWFGRRIR